MPKEAQEAEGMVGPVGVGYMMPKEAHAAEGRWGMVGIRLSGVVPAPLGRAWMPAM